MHVCTDHCMIGRIFESYPGNNFLWAVLRSFNTAKTQTVISQHPQFWRNVWLSCKKVFVKVAEQRNKPCHNRRRILKNSKLNCFYRRVLQIIDRGFRNGKYALIFILELYKCMLFKTIDRFLARQIRKYNMFPVTFQNSKSNIFFVIVLNSKYNGYVRYTVHSR